MRKVLRPIAIAIALTTAPTTALATCGIGSQIWEGSDGWGPWLAAFTTNVWTAKGISTTFEVAGCTEDDNLLKKLLAYTGDNMDHLAVQMARGEGEHVDALAQLLAVRGEHRSHFGSFLQANLPALLTHDRVTAGELLGSLATLMAEDETFAAYVQG